MPVSGLEPLRLGGVGIFGDFRPPGSLTYMGVSTNGGTPQTPQNDQFLVGKPMVVGYHYLRNPPYSP